MITPGGWGLFAGWLLKSSAQAALLVVLVLAVQWLLRRRLTPHWRYFLWWLVVARLLMPVSLPGPVSIFNWVKWNSPPAPAMAVMPITPDVSLPASPPDTAATAIEETTPALPAESPVTIAAPTPTAPTRPRLDWRLGVMWLWLAGAALLGARLVWSVLHMRRELRTATPVDDPTVLALLDECRERMRVRDGLTLLETPLVNSPALCGFWRPRLLLPPGLCRDFTAQQLRFIFLHELAHVRRHDIAVNWVITLLQLLHWFNPFVWLAFSRLRADRELACDALALSVAAPGEQHAYGQTIIRLLEGFARPSAMPGLVGILEDKNQMKRRIRMIAQFRRPGRWAWLSGIAAAILGIACLTDAQVPSENDQAKNRPGTSEREVALGSSSVTNQIEMVPEAARPIRAKPEYPANVDEPPVPVPNSLPTMSITSDGSIDLNMATGQIEARSNVVIESDQQTMKCSSLSITRRDGKFVFKCTGGRLEMVRTRSPLTSRVPRLAGDVPERGFREDETVSGLSDTSGQALPEVISGTVFETKAGKRTLGFAWESNIDRAANVSMATIRDFRIRLGGSLIWGDTATLLHEGDQLIIRVNQLFIEEKRRVSPEKPVTSNKQLLTPGAATNAEHAKVESVSLHSEKADLPKPSADGTGNSNPNETTTASSAANRGSLRPQGGRTYVNLWLDVRPSGFSDYDRRITAKVQDRCDAILDAYPKTVRLGKVEVRFDLMPDGKIRDLKVERETVGDLPAEFCQRAIQEAVPFPPWPEEMRRLIGQESREMKFTFFFPGFGSVAQERVRLGLDRDSIQLQSDSDKRALPGSNAPPSYVISHETMPSKMLGNRAPSNGMSVKGFNMQRSKNPYSPEGCEDLTGEIWLAPGSPQEDALVSPPFYQKYRMLISGDNGFAFVNEFNGFKRHIDGPVAQVWAKAFPRDSRIMRFRIEERETADSRDWSEAASFEVENPKPAQIEPWKAETLPRVMLTNGLEMEIGEINVRENKPNNPRSIWTHTGYLPVRFLSNGNLATNWGIVGGMVRDASGNYDPFTFVAGTTNFNDWTVYRMHRVLDPTKVWKFRLHCSRVSEFPATNQFSFAAQWPMAAPSQRSCGAYQVEVKAVNRTMLSVEMLDKPRQKRVVFVSAVDEAGNGVADFVGSRGQHVFWQRLKPQTQGKVRVTIAIEDDFETQFTLQPKWEKPANGPRVELLEHARTEPKQRADKNPGSAVPGAKGERLAPAEGTSKHGNSPIEMPPLSLRHAGPQYETPGIMRYSLTQLRPLIASEPSGHRFRYADEIDAVAMRQYQAEWESFKTGQRPPTPTSLYPSSIERLLESEKLMLSDPAGNPVHGGNSRP